MPRRKTNFFTGGYYHLYNRGAGKQPIFLSPLDYHQFSRRMFAIADRLELGIIAFALMPNHFHIFLKQLEETPAGKLPQFLCNSYSRSFNKLHQRSGTLFQGRYGSRRISKDNDAQQLCAYIHTNPVVAGLVENPLRWPYTDLEIWFNPSIATRPKLKLMEDVYPELEHYPEFLREFLANKTYNQHLERINSG